MVENSKDVARQNLLQLVERVDAVSHLIHTERNIREASKQGIERQIQGVRDFVEADRSQRRSENAATASLIEESRKAVLEESRMREALENKNVYDLGRMNERIEQLGRAHVDKIQDLEEQMKKAMKHFVQQVTDRSKEVTEVRTW